VAIRDLGIEGENGEHRCTTRTRPPAPPDPTSGARPGPTKRARIYRADTWHIEDGTGTDGSGEPPKRNPVRRAFSAEYELAILAEYDA
jgi:hypothetical protein